MTNKNLTEKSWAYYIFVHIIEELTCKYLLKKCNGGIHEHSNVTRIRKITALTFISRSESGSSKLTFFSICQLQILFFASSSSFRMLILSPNEFLNFWIAQRVPGMWFSTFTGMHTMLGQASAAFR